MEAGPPRWSSPIGFPGWAFLSERSQARHADGKTPSWPTAPARKKLRWDLRDGNLPGRPSCGGIQGMSRSVSNLDGAANQTIEDLSGGGGGQFRMITIYKSGGTVSLVCNPIVFSGLGLVAGTVN